MLPLAFRCVRERGGQCSSGFICFVRLRSRHTSVDRRVDNTTLDFKLKRYPAIDRQTASSSVRANLRGRPKARFRGGKGKPYRSRLLYKDLSANCLWSSSEHEKQYCGPYTCINDCNLQGRRHVAFGGSALRRSLKEPLHYLSELRRLR
jgi:hypothetical protein